MEGERLDATTSDISAGGVFLQTTDDLPLGVPLALVFKGSHFSAPIYLVGEVVRHEVSESRIGVGLQFEKAVTESSPDDLVLFLEAVVGVEDPHIVQQFSAKSGHRQSVFTFPKIASCSAEEIAQLREIEDEQTAEMVAKKSTRPRIPLRPPVSPKPLSSSTTSPTRAYRRGRDDGALTRQIMQGEVQARAKLKATLRKGRGSVPVTITRLGLTGMFATTRRPSGSGNGQASVDFELRIRGGMADISCRCKIRSISRGGDNSPPGYELDILDVDEGLNRGVFPAYVRWLSFRQLTTK